MQRTTGRTRGRVGTAGLIGIFLLLLGIMATSGGTALAARNINVGNGIGKGAAENGLYIVQMLDLPVVAYDGGIAGLKGTKPNRGQKINPNNPDVVKYVKYLDDKHDAKLRGVGASKVYSYRYSFNGFAASMNAAQAAQLALDPEVVNVVKDTKSTIDTSSTPSFLEVDASGGIWDQLGGPVGGKNGPGAGEGVIVGIIDSGIWPENASFSDRDANGKLVFQQIPGWHGKCIPGEDFTAANCNQKLIGAQWFGAGFGGPAGIKAEFPYEFVSARDADGHGSHTASTAAGNYGVPAIVDGIDLGTISGMAPRARVAVYKTCWGNNGEGGCFNSDNVAAIDQAVADGVDVINYSISGTSTNFLDPVEVAFLFAADAGVFVAASAGNSGPGASTVAHPSPWIATVAASTHDRVYEATATLGNGVSYTGAGLGAAVPSAPLVYAGDVGLSGADATQVQLCYPGTLDPALVSGKIVVCDRDAIARTAKSLAVQEAGGVGMILVNRSPSSLNADLHYVPTVHLSHLDRPAIIAYASGSGATAALSAGEGVAGAEAPFMASFSSRGPLLAGNGDLLKPDITAPGVDVLAAVSPIGYNGRSYDFLSGTSMSSPHMAGIAALMKDLKPTWTPAMIKSALMTSASQTTNQGNPIDGGPFAYGAGHVVPNSATDPGLVYNAGFNDWLGFLCGTGQLTAGYCSAIEIDPSDLNYPSISIGSLAGVQTVTRRVTNVGPSATYNVSVEAPAGVDVSVSPSSLTLATGQSASYQVTFTVTDDAAINEYAFGALTWSHGPHAVRSPLVVKPVALAVPAAVSSDGSDISYDLTFGYSGDFSASVAGMTAATETPGNVVDDPANDINTALGTGVGVTFHVINIPAGTQYARFSLFDSETDGNDDLDLYVFQPNGSFAGGSGSGTSAEEVNVANPVAGNWIVAVHGWQTDGADSNYTLFSWAVGGDEGNTTLSAPNTATLGETETISLSFNGLSSATRYLGLVNYASDGNPAGSTIVTVNTP